MSAVLGPNNDKTKDATMARGYSSSAVWHAAPDMGPGRGTGRLGARHSE